MTKSLKSMMAGLSVLALCALAGPVAFAQHTTHTQTTAPGLTQAMVDAAHGMECCAASAKEGLVCLTCTPDAKAEINKAAPNFELTGLDEKKVMLSDLMKDDKNVMLIWANHECPIYARVANEGTIKKIVEAFKDKPVTIAQIDSTAAGKVADIKAAQEKMGYKGAYLTDFAGKVGHAYDAKTTPQVFIINKDGKLVFNGAIDNDPTGATPVATRTVYAITAMSSVLEGKTPAEQTVKPYGCTVKYAPKTTGTEQ